MSYKYHSLVGSPDPSIIRLIRLEPGGFESSLQCELITASLDQNPHFDALSYCWGSEKKSRTLLCGSDQLSITENLSQALCRLRRETEVRVVWADAVCINQDDPDEKSIQVQLMTRIYKEANEVMIWLSENESEAEGEEVASLINQLCEAGLAQGRADDARNYYQLMFEGDVGKYSLPNPRDRRWIALGNLVQRPWFSRIWIIQEVTLPRQESVQMLVGDTELSWMLFCYAVSYCRSSLDIFDLVPGPLGLESRHTSAAYLAQIFSLFETHRLADQDRTLLSLLIRHRAARATDSRDKIYALCGLASDMNKFPTLIPDYNLDPVDLYQRTAIRLIKGSGNLDVLSIARRIHPNAALSTLPSWVPDWYSQEGTGELCMSASGMKRYFNFDASCSSPPIMRISGDTLFLSGLVLDRIVERSISFNTYEPVHTWIKSITFLVQAAIADSTLKDWARVSRARSGTTYITGESIQDAYLLTMVFGYLPPGHSLKLFRITDMTTRVRRPFFTLFRILYRWNLASASYLLFMSYTILNALMGIVLASFYQAHPELAFGLEKNRCMIRTREGYIGAAPELVNVGDTIAIMHGGRVPLILRQGENEDKWELIGDCYVHGVMHGEAFDKTKCREFCII
jgi:hypothetical protein